MPRAASAGMLLPLALPLLGATALGGTHGHVKYLSFYDYNAAEQHSFCSIGLFTHLQGNTLQSNSSLLSAWEKYGFPSVLDVEDLGGGFNDGLYSRGGFNHTHLNPRWKSLIDGVLASALPHIGKTKAIRGIFLGDEPCCGGLPAAELDELATHVKTKLVGTGAFIYVNECSSPFVGISPGHDGCPVGSDFCPFSGLMGAKIPSALDFISVDMYKSNNGTEPAIVRQFYEESVYPKLAAHQSTWVVPGTFAQPAPYVSLAESTKVMLEKINGYWSWAQNDTRVVGINPWHWGTWGSMQKGDDIYKLGAHDFPAVRARLQEIGAIVKKNYLGGYGGLGKRPPQ